MSEHIGIFRAVETRDAEALARDGEPYYAIHRLSEARPDRGGAAPRPGGGELHEVRFGDGIWMLARALDLAVGDGRHPDVAP